MQIRFPEDTTPGSIERLRWKVDAEDTEWLGTGVDPRGSRLGAAAGPHEAVFYDWQTPVCHFGILTKLRENSAL